MIVRLPNIAATHEWHRGTPDAHTEACTVSSIDVDRQQAYVQWPASTRRLPGGGIVRRPSMWVALDRLTFDGMSVVHVLADADRARQAAERRAAFALVPALTEV